MDMNLNDDDIKIKMFRRVLHDIKVNVLNRLTYKTQDTGALTQVSKRLIQFYTLLKPVVLNEIDLYSIEIDELKTIFEPTLNNNMRSSYYENQLSYYLKRDLIDFPFTLDNIEIDSYSPDEHYEEPTIIENNLDLTN